MLRERKRKAEKSNNHAKKEVLRPSEIISKIPLRRETKILKILLVSAAIKGAIMLMNIWS